MAGYAQRTRLGKTDGTGLIRLIYHIFTIIPHDGLTVLTSGKW